MCLFILYYALINEYNGKITCLYTIIEIENIDLTLNKAENNGTAVEL